MTAPTTPQGPGPNDPLPDDLKKALQAFKKRLKLTRLDQESKLGHGPMSAGRRSEVRGIIPPREYPLTTWEELTRRGRLRNLGQGFYELINP